ncbi:MAG: hypothetical protein M0026_05875 [Nocardiopsaceae bacterium]|nr:hypothetical protein [Nocardiopsaceae bacterium]
MTRLLGAAETALPAPLGVMTESLGRGAVAEITADLFGRGRRCAVLDEYAPGEPQWLLAELGDGRITGGCPAAKWRLSSCDPVMRRLSAPPLAADGTDLWRLLDATLFSPSAQIHITEAGEAAWLSRDSGDSHTLPDWLRPRDRSFLLTGWLSEAGYSRTLDGAAPFSIGRELSGTTACHPVAWQDFDVPPDPAADRTEQERSRGAGSWIRVREYWAEDPFTGAAGVAFHRLTGYHAGSKPTAPIGLDGPDDR